MDKITFRETNTADEAFVKKIMDEYWGGEPLLIRDSNYWPSKLPGIIAEKNEQLIGFLFYEIQHHDCEIVVFETFDKFKGTGTELLHRLTLIAKKHHCQRIYLMTHNDNLDALRFYQRRGFVICGIRLNSMDAARKIKPSIPIIGDYGIPLRDEINLELALK